MKLMISSRKPKGMQANVLGIACLALAAISVALGLIALVERNSARSSERFVSDVIAESNSFERLGAAEKGCAQRGGEISRGPFGEVYCKIRYRDAGVACSDMSECLGGCIAPGGTARPSSTANLVGVCRASNASSGCISYLAKGRVLYGVCED